MEIFKGKGKFLTIGEVKNLYNDTVKYLEVSMKMSSNQILNFYLTEHDNTPHAFQEIRRNFTAGMNPCQVGDEIDFNFTIVFNQKSGMYKLKMEEIFNRKFNVLEN